MIDEDDRPLPVTLRLDPAAEAIFEQYELELATERVRLGASEDADSEVAYLGWLGKFAGQTARLAACLHAATHWTTGTTTNIMISDTTIMAAVELARYFHAHASVVLGLMGELPEQRRAETVLGWLNARTPQELATLTVRDVHRSRGKRTTAAQTRAALRILEEHGYLRLDKQPRLGRGGRTSERVHVHPELLALGAGTDITDAGSSSGSSVSRVGPDATDADVPAAVQHRERGCNETRVWRARDAVMRCVRCDPPVFSAEVVQDRIQRGTDDRGCEKRSP